jgi:hypothetical protein
MSFGTPATPEQIKHFKSAAAGLSGRTAGDAIVKSILDFYKAEITVLDRYAIGELFRVGIGYPSHGIYGIHVHPIRFHGLTGESRAHKDPVELMTDEKFNMYVGLLLQALETGCFRSTVKSR